MVEYIELAICYLYTFIITLPNRNFYCEVHSRLILYCSRIRKNITDREKDKEKRTENREQTEKPVMEATLIMDGLPG